MNNEMMNSKENTSPKFLEYTGKIENFYDRIMPWLAHMYDPETELFIDNQGVTNAHERASTLFIQSSI